MALTLIRKKIAAKRVEYPGMEGVAVTLRPMVRSRMRFDLDTGMPDVAATFKQQVIYCWTGIEGIRFKDEEGKDIPFNDELKALIFDRPQDIGFPIEFLNWIQEQIEETSTLEDVAKNWTSSQSGKPATSPASDAANSQKSKDSNPPATTAKDTKSPDS